MPIVYSRRLDQTTINQFIAGMLDSDLENAWEAGFQLIFDEGGADFQGTGLGGFTVTGATVGSITAIDYSHNFGGDFTITGLVASAGSLKSAILARDAASVINLLFGRADHVAGISGVSGGSQDHLVLHGFGGNDLVESKTERAQLWGDEGNDTLEGSWADDTLYGGAGNDALKAGPGDDLIDGGDGVDTITIDTLMTGATGATVDLRITGPQNTGQGTDTLLSIENIIGTKYSDVLHGNDLANTINGGNDGADEMYGHGGDDTFFMTWLSGVIDGGAGIDTLNLSVAARGYSVDLGIVGVEQTVYVTEYPWNSPIKLTLSGIEKIVGSAQGDNLKAGAAGVQFSGGGGHDSLEGGNGADTLEGGSGNDTIIGGSGYDIAVYTGAAANYRITSLGGGKLSVVDLRSGSPHGTDQLEGIEKITFLDKDVIAIEASLTTTTASIYNGSGGTVAFQVKLSAAADQDVVLHIKPNQGLAGTPVSYQYRTDWTLNGGEGFTYNADLDVGIVTIPKGETSVTIRVPIRETEFKIGAAVDTFKIALAVAPTTPANVAVSADQGAALGVVEHPDVPANRLILSYNGSFGADWAKYQPLFERDMQAAMARVAEALPHDLTGLTVRVNAGFMGDPPAAGALQLAQARPGFVTGWFAPNGDWQLTPGRLPEALVRYKTGTDADPSQPDIDIWINPAGLGIYYGGGPDYATGPASAVRTVDAQTTFTHELLHGLGFGSPSSLLGYTPWSINLDRVGYTFQSGKIVPAGWIGLGDGSVVPATAHDGHGHLAVETDLMWWQHTGPANISATDIQILAQIGYSSASSIKVGLLPTALQKPLQNLLRGGVFSDLYDLVSSFGGSSGSTLALEGAAASPAPAAIALSLNQIIAELVKRADATTSVATMAYQFFTGKIPSEAGIDYLVAPFGPNPNNLNSAYYQSFNLENRYINFAVNLGKVGEGTAKFLTDYGSLSLAAATKKAYGVIFGVTPTDAKVAALLAGGRDAYFASYGGDGPNGQGTKAAMVGWLLAEAAKADLGMYARANDAFLLDLADGANFAVDLIGVYGRPEFNFGG